MLLTEVQHQLRVKHYSIRTEQSYLSWIRRFIRFHGRRHPREMGRPEHRNIVNRTDFPRHENQPTPPRCIGCSNRIVLLR
ncbi:phage integrase N-terminal SAM-like domain-containing protein [Abyssibacter sp.]|uniref:phage integrase N-terminal SAM-like domain-containing protein n=1 Tax=Abyssibacter sp. TaxID=2320200 RepID=UPI00351398C6